MDGAGGERGDDVLAKHFLWLHQNRTPLKDGNRFLVEGSLDSELIHDMALESGIMPMVVETIIDLISTAKNSPGLHIDEEIGAVYLLAHAVVEHHAKIARRGSKAIGHRQVGQALRTLKHPLWEEGLHKVPDSNGKIKRARWWMVDNKLLLRAAQANGFRTDRIITLAAKEREDA